MKIVESPLVSIVCTTYNHEKYIADALEGFVSQKTTFPFEILVMDDASTDGTADIIMEYEKKYSELIKPVYQKENQFSKGLRPGQQNRDRAIGKYIALCEGDDYWIDEYKLQKQVDYMEAHPECTFCFTNGYSCYGNQKPTDKKLIPWNGTAIVKKNSSIYDVAEIEQLGYIPTCSFIWRNGLEELSVSANAFKGDAYHKISMTNHGYAYFINEPMVVYRRGDENSATGRWRKNVQNYAKYCDKFISLFSDLEEILDKKYSNVMAMRICQWKISKYYALRDYSKLHEIIESKEIKNLRYCNLASRLYYSMKCRYPKLFAFLIKLVAHR